MLDILGDFTSRQGYSSLRLDGATSTANRAKYIKQFNENPLVFLFLISTGAGGLGINLVSASKVVVRGTPFAPLPVHIPCTVHRPQTAAPW